jgi:hypothetical protein
LLQSGRSRTSYVLRFSYGAAALAEALPGLRVKDLSLERNQIADVGAAALAEALPGLGLRYACGSPITQLDLGNNQITDAGAVALAEARAAGHASRKW